MTDSDNPNLNNGSHDRHEWWKAQKDEYAAKMRDNAADTKREANDGWKDMETEFEAVVEQGDAKWDEFTAKVQKWWNKGEEKVDEAI